MSVMIDPVILQRAQVWLTGEFDEETRAQVKDLINDKTAELIDSFYRDLEFGTGGLRGIMGAGTNRMNKYTVGMATQGLVNYLIKMFPAVAPIKVAIAYDSRNNSKFFAGVCADVLSANGFEVYLFDDLRPTPELSFAIRYLRCQSGIMITASHNPKEYNGYKAYWDDGAQMIAPHDTNVIDEVKKISAVAQVKWNGIPDKIHLIGEDIDKLYISNIALLSLSPEAINNKHDLTIIYTPLHGTGRVLVPRALKEIGFTRVIMVEEQATADGNFPTVHSPNPEEHSALDMAIKKAEALNADLVMATDPDADRVGIAVKNNRNEFILLNGNQTASILFYYVLNQWKKLGKLKGNEFIVSTIVTSGLLEDIARKFKVETFSVLTGFKYIADIIRKNEGTRKFIIGGEESYGYLVGDFVRDKDAVGACAMIAETAAWAALQGKTLFELLSEIYHEFGMYKECLISLTKKGKSGAEEIRQMMINYRSEPMKKIGNSKVVRIKDYFLSRETDCTTGSEIPITLPVSDVLQFILDDGSKISVRPSGTEPKIKFYFSVKEIFRDNSGYDETVSRLDKRIDEIITLMNLK